MKSVKEVMRNDVAALVALSLVLVVMHAVTNGQYGFHRDELATLDDARHMDWGFVAYPPLTPMTGWVALTLFGVSLRGVRLLATVALAVEMVLTGLMARELGGGRREALLAATAAGIAPIALAEGTVLQYVSLDMLWWVLVAYFLVRLLKSEDPRWWIWVGAAIGIGFETKYTMAFLGTGLVGALLLTPARKYLASKWLWAGVGVALLIFLPNLVWQARHGFISLEFLKSIHARDVRIGRATNFLPGQLYVCLNLVTVPLWLAGMVFFFVDREGKRYRMLGWLFVLTFALFWKAQARSYYTAALYPMGLAAGSVLWGRGMDRLSRGWSRTLQTVSWGLVAAGAVLFCMIALPWANVDSRWWKGVNKRYDMFREELGWTDLVATVARVYNEIPPEEKARTGILVGNYGEAGAINLFGDQYKLPKAISGTNSGWYRGYGNGPQTLIVVGLDLDYLSDHFATCNLAAHNTNSYGVKNEESHDHPNIFVCRGMRETWPEFWKQFRHFG